MNDGPETRSPALRRGGFLALALAALLAVSRLRRARDAARDVPFSPLFARGRVGAAYLERRGVGTGGEVAGEMDDMDAYARPDFDPGRVHPEVRRFYERTAEYELAYAVTWHPGFRLGAALVAPITRRLEQLNLPGRGTDDPRSLESRFVALDDGADPREGARAWIRTDPESGEAVFVALYASHERGGARYVNIAVPLPLSNLSTVLAVDALEAGSDDGTGLLLTTAGSEDGGLYLVTPLGAFALPLAQTFRVWPAGAPGAPPGPIGDAAVVATHEMWLFGRQFLTISYAGVRPTVRGSE